MKHSVRTAEPWHGSLARIARLTIRGLWGSADQVQSLGISHELPNGSQFACTLAYTVYLNLKVVATAKNGKYFRFRLQNSAAASWEADVSVVGFRPKCGREEAALIRKSQPDSLHLAQCNFVLCPVVKFGCPRSLMAGHLLGVGTDDRADTARRSRHGLEVGAALRPDIYLPA